MNKIEQKFSVYCLNLRKAQDRITMLKTELGNFLLQMFVAHPTQSAAQRIFLEIVKNHIRHRNGRHYTIKMLACRANSRTSHPHRLISFAKSSLSRGISSQLSFC
jgi:hypothetical protein